MHREPFQKEFKSKKSDCLYISVLFYTEQVLYVDLLCKMPQRIGWSVRSVMHFKAGVIIIMHTSLITNQPDGVNMLEGHNEE